jgi:hypothetical protein
MSKPFDKKLSPLARQAVLLAADNPIELGVLYNVGGELEKVLTPFEMRALPDNKRRHCRKILFINGKSGLAPVAPEKAP